MSSWPEGSLGKPPYEGLTNHSLNSVKSAYVCSAQIFIVGSRSVENLGLHCILTGHGFRHVHEIPSLLDPGVIVDGKPQLFLITELSPDESLDEAILAVRAANAEARIVVLVDMRECAVGDAAIRLSAHALLDHTISPEVLIRTIDVVLGNVGVLSDSFLPHIGTRPTMSVAHTAVDGNDEGELPASLPCSQLTNREADILKYLVDGVSNKMIARQLDIAEATVKIHVKGILRKINVRNRTQAAIWALAHPVPTETSLETTHPLAR
ncbi:LuxR C-terminal-related transcriptional regulator [Methylorubrum sp. POS3]|uniref:LuxR C-terminal-related transcriptional regulator n=1 Tax=Methylorubrum sp. POS3 TaxID=2998492 RepID=UPI00372BE225